MIGPRVFARLARRLDHLVPLLRAAFGVAEHALALHPPRRRQDQVGHGGGGRGVDVADHDEAAIVRRAIEPRAVRQRHPRVRGLDPQRLQVTTLQGAEHVHGVVTRDGGNGAGWQLPDAFGFRPVLGVGHHHVGGQPVVRRPDFAGRAAGARLPRQAQRVGARPADLARNQMQVGDEVVHPRAAHVLVDAHAPETHGASGQVAVDVGQRANLLDGHARDLADVGRRVVREERPQLVERTGPGLILERVALGLVAEAAVADLLHVLDAAPEDHVLVDERRVNAALGHQQVEDPVGERQVGARLEQHEQVGVVRGWRAARGDVDDAGAGLDAAGLEDAAEEHGVHLRHVVAPQDEVVADVEVLVAAHGLVALELRDEPRHRAGHAEPGVRLEVVALEPALHPLQRGVTVEHGPLSRPVHPHRVRAVLVQRLLELRRDQVQRLVPRDARERSVGVALLRVEQAILAVQQPWQVVALHAQQALVDRAGLVTPHRDDASLFHADHHAAARAAEPARRLVPGHRRAVHGCVGAGQARGLVAVGARVRGHRRRGRAGELEERPPVQRGAHRSCLVCP